MHSLLELWFDGIFLKLKWHSMTYF